MNPGPLRRIGALLRRRTAEQILVLGYGLACVVGFGLLLLPWSRTGSLSWLDVLFTAPFRPRRSARACSPSSCCSW